MLSRISIMAYSAEMRLRYRLLVRSNENAASDMLEYFFLPYNRENYIRENYMRISLKINLSNDIYDNIIVRVSTAKPIIFSRNLNFSVINRSFWTFSFFILLFHIRSESRRQWLIKISQVCVHVCETVGDRGKKQQGRYARHDAARTVK